MSAPRRSMTAALQTAELSETEKAFIRGDRVARAVSSAPVPEPVSEVQAAEPEVQPTAPVVKAAAKAPVRMVPAMVNLSTRIPAELQERLMRAAFDRKLAQQEPYTHQDIVIEALAAWLKKAGY